MTNCKVYWIKRKLHNDLKTEGYIGVSSDPKFRKIQHEKYSKINPRLKRALEKYDDVEIDIIYEGTREECLKEEYRLRPSKLIGWNLEAGGGDPPSHKGRKWSEERRLRYLKTIKENNSNYRSPEQRLKMAESRARNGFYPYKNLSNWSAAKTKWWTDGNVNKRSDEKPSSEFYEGRTKFKKYGTDKQCPHCGKIGRGSGMVRFHFENCKKK